MTKRYPLLQNNIKKGRIGSPELKEHKGFSWFAVSDFSWISSSIQLTYLSRLCES